MCRLYKIFIVLFLFCLFGHENILASPVSIRIEASTENDFHLGPGPREHFELLEEYHPLGTAVNAKHAQNITGQKLAPSAQTPSKGNGVETRTQSSEEISSSEENSSETVGILEPPAPTTAPLEPEEPIVVQAIGRNRYQNIKPLNPKYKSKASPNKSRWLEWSRWSECSEGKRIRTRKCYEIGGIRCEGSNIDIQLCFSTDEQNIPVAKDPHIIEKEILG
uniref:Uncharacterized protein n=1 Tax=Acrobeloides nanus TaxID=290746 RepID=A0A914C7S8_9BILA